MGNDVSMYLLGVLPGALCTGAGLNDCNFDAARYPHTIDIKSILGADEENVYAVGNRTNSTLPSQHQPLHQAQRRRNSRGGLGRVVLILFMP